MLCLLLGLLPPQLITGSWPHSLGSLTHGQVPFLDAWGWQSLSKLSYLPSSQQHPGAGQTLLSSRTESTLAPGAAK